MPKERMTIDHLARMVKRGFDGTASKAELKTLREEVATKQEIQRGFKVVADELDLIHHDIHDIKIVLGPLVRTVAAMDANIRDLNRRVDRLEEKIGLRK